MNLTGPKIQLLLDSIHNPIIAIDTKGLVITCNKAMAAVLGKAPHDIIRRPITNILDYAQLVRILKTGQNEIAGKIKINDKLYMANRSMITVDDAILGAISVLQDISELESISLELKQSQHFSKELEAIIESSYDGIYVTDGEARTLLVNSAYERITGIKRSEVLGRTMHELVDAGFFSGSVTLKVLETTAPSSLVQTAKTGKTVMVTGNPFFDDQGNINLIVTNVRDVTELHLMQQRLETLQKHHHETETELRHLRGDFSKQSRVVMRSKKMQELRRTSLRLAQVESTVLLQGESGSGKEIFADLIHSSGPRRKKPLIKVNCGALPENLLEAELFGYAAGSFTGAHRNGKAGLFEAAHGGTIFLDEFGEMVPSLQVKLLRVLQEREVLRIGATSPVTIDVRIIAATNRDLEQLVAEKQLREDLFFRINVVRLTIPPLRERREDILPMAYAFLDFFNRQYHLNKQLDKPLMNKLLGYDWPGNVRELKNLIEQLVVITEDDIITEHNLPIEWDKRPTRSPLDALGKQSLNEIMSEVESNLLQSVMHRCKTTREAAQILQVDQSTVARKLKRYGIKES